MMRVRATIQAVSCPPARTDVAIVGAGILGCAAAAYLAAAGASVLIVDEIGIAGGASGRNSGAIEHPYDDAQRAIYEQSLGLMRDQGLDLPERASGVLLLSRDGAAAAALAQRMREAHPELDARLVDPDELAATEPLVAIGHWACRVDTGHPVPPRLATELYFELAERHGARLHAGADATLLWDGDTCTGLAVGEHRLIADHVVVAAGAATCAIVDPSGSWAPVLASWGVNLELGLASQPRHILLEAAVKDAQAGDVPLLDHAFSLICAEQRSWLGSTFLALEPSPGDWQARIVSRGAAFVPALADAPVLARLACARPRSIDGRPLLGHVAGAQHLLVATGNGGRGISTGAASGQLVAQAILSGSDTAIPRDLRADRFPLTGPEPGEYSRGRGMIAPSDRPG
jgi:D-amino-acid dehydrogenase